jgi:DNA recombination protein RmuC
VPPFFIALLAAVLAAIFTWLILRGNQAGLNEQLRSSKNENTRLQTDKITQQSRIIELEAARSRAEQDLAATRAASAERLTAEQQRFTEQEQRTAQYLKDIEKMRSTLQTEFQAVATKLLDEKSAKFTEQNKTQLDVLLSPLKQQLVDFRTRIDTVYKTESDDRTALKSQIEQLRLLNAHITDEAHSLTQALKGQAQVRGAWGELVLERLLEGCGLRRGEDYVVQESLPDKDGRQTRPDIIIRLPEQRHLVIDSKVSLVDYERAANATETAPQETAKRAHVTAVKKRVQELCDKKYEDAGALFSPEYVFMFIPIEPAFAMALETEPGLYDWAFERKIILVTSSGLLAALRTVATIWKQDRQTKNVQEIARRGGLLYDKFAGLYTDLEVIGGHLNKARESYDDVLGKLKTGRGNLLSQVEELKTLGARAQKSLPPSETADGQ